MHVLKTNKSFKKEFRKQLRFAITAAIGFSIAYAWRNAIYDSMQNYVARILDVVPNHYLTEVYTAFTITALGVLLIFITSQILRE